MTRSTVTKLAVQAIAAALGTLGLLWLFMGVWFAFVGIRDRDLFTMLGMTPIFLALGTIVTWAAHQNLRHFGPASIRSITAIASLLLLSSANSLLRPFQDSTWDLQKTTGEPQMWLLHFASITIPLLGAYLFYSALSRKLIEITGTDKHPT